MTMLKWSFYSSLLFLSCCIKPLFAQNSDGVKTGIHSTDSLMYELPGGYLKIHQDSISHNQDVLRMIESANTVKTEEEPNANSSTEEQELKWAEHSPTEWHADPGVSRYFYAPSAILPEKGKLTLSQKELIFTSVSYGLTDHVAVVGGAVVPAWFPGFYHGILGVKAGYSFSKKTHLAGGFETMAGGADGNFGSITLPFATFTYGDNYANATINVGKPFAWEPKGRNSFEETSSFIVSPSAYYRITEEFALLSENWFFIDQIAPGDEGADESIFAFSGMVRFVGEKMTADLGFMVLPDVEFPFPLLSFSYSW